MSVSSALSLLVVLSVCSFVCSDETQEVTPASLVEKLSAILEKIKNFRTEFESLATSDPAKHQRLSGVLTAALMEGQKCWDKEMEPHKNEIEQFNDEVKNLFKSSSGEGNERDDGPPVVDPSNLGATMNDPKGVNLDKMEEKLTKIFGDEKTKKKLFDIIEMYKASFAEAKRCFLDSIKNSGLTDEDSKFLSELWNPPKDN